MTEGYYCSRCDKFVLARKDVFAHLHLGMKTCLVCSVCQHHVYLKGTPPNENGISELV